VGGSMQTHRVHLFRGYPHRTACAMLLKMAFVLEPQVKIVSSSEMAEFFYIGVAPRGRGGPRAAEVCASGIPTAKTAVGTAAPPGGCRRCGRGDD
jgi:hypothetical protein